MAIIALSSERCSSLTWAVWCISSRAACTHDVCDRRQPCPAQPVIMMMRRMSCRCEYRPNPVAAIILRCWRCSSSPPAITSTGRMKGIECTLLY